MSQQKDNQAIVVGHDTDGNLNITQAVSEVGDISDGYHTFNELYHYRMLYNAAWLNALYDDLLLHVQHGWLTQSNLEAYDLHKSWKHSDGEDCFGGGWFIVVVDLPSGQVTNHYEAKDWEKFRIPEREKASEWDGHTPQEAAERLEKYLIGDW
jgi:hypothetical protein